MESCLTHITFTVVRMDGILILGENGCEDKENLIPVLKVLKACG